MEQSFLVEEENDHKDKEAVGQVFTDDALGDNEQKDLGEGNVGDGNDDKAKWVESSESPLKTRLSRASGLLQWLLPVFNAPYFLSTESKLIPSAALEAMALVSLIASDPQSVDRVATWSGTPTHPLSTASSRFLSPRINGRYSFIPCDHSAF